MTMSDSWTLLRAAWDLRAATRAGADGIAARRQSRLAALMAHARAHSAFYRDHYAGLPDGPLDMAALRRLPPTSKPDLMAAFDRWVTDPEVTRSAVDGFVGDPGRVGELFRDRFAVWTTSGTTGVPGRFVHDRQAQAVYQALAVRLYRSVLSRELVIRRLRGRRRTAAVFVTGGHFAGAAGLARAQRQHPRLAAGSKLMSALDPLPKLVAELNGFAPSLLAGYPSVLSLLATEQEAGRLQLAPALLIAGGEQLSSAVRQRAESAFGCPMRDTYGASEFPGMAYGCGHGWLHLHADWAVLEPVDADLRPVPPGESSATVLLTNLANRVQPLIRYDLGDRVQMSPEPCACGSPLPALRVEGRTNDTLAVETRDGRTVRLLPLAVVTVVEETPGVRRCQLVQTGPATLRVRLEPYPGADPWTDVARRLRAFLAEQGAPDAGIERASEPPGPDPRSGKFRQAWIELPANAEGR
ncbi:MAG TPA: AMP-binding protein [Actinoplanes sp.]|nr:AMP-binding protein [Actinoplanes sp.]